MGALHLLGNNTEIVKRWVNEIQEAAQNKNTMVQVRVLCSCVARYGAPSLPIPPSLPPCPYPPPAHPLTGPLIPPLSSLGHSDQITNSHLPA